ncbi:MAG: carbohydrate kinase family protein [Clostridium sp.]|nr:carbohydrate kinase family protein [Clostridium sp.]
MSEGKKILIFGLLYIESVLQIKGDKADVLPRICSYCDINMLISGDGIYMAKALSCLGDKVDLVSFIGDDFAGKLIRNYLHENNINDNYISNTLERTLLSVVKKSGNDVLEQFIDFKELKDIDISLYTKAIQECNIAILDSKFYSERLIRELYEFNKFIALKVDSSEVNNEFVKYADILFVDRCKEESVDRLIKNVQGDNSLVIFNYWDKGCMLYLKEGSQLEWFPIVKTRKVLNKVGANEALLAAFVNCYCNGETPHKAMEKAMAFSSYKVGAQKNLDGFISKNQLDKLHHFLYN